MGASLDIIGRCGEASNVDDSAKSARITIKTIAVPSNEASRSVGAFHSAAAPFVPLLWLVTADARVAAMNGIQIGVGGCLLYN
jgi:hypothetical protein